MITIIVNGKHASLTRYKWSCEDKDIERMLNLVTELHAPMSSDPDPERTIYEAIRGRVPIEKVVTYNPETVGGDWIVTKDGTSHRPKRNRGMSEDS